MKRAMVALAVLSTSVLGVANADRLAFVDMRRAIQECVEGKTAQKKLGEELEAKQKELDADKVKLKEMSEALTKEEASLKAEELDKRRRALREKYFELEKSTGLVKQELRKKEAAAVRPLRDKILFYIATIAQREKLTHILHAESLLWTETSAMDLTNEVIRMADTSYAKAQKKPAKEEAPEKSEK